MSERIWVTWENQRRNKTLSEKLNAKLYQFEAKTNRFLRYVILIAKTLKVYITEKPKIIFVQNPSIVLALFSVLYGRFVKTVVIVDAHNAGIFPLDWWGLQPGSIRWLANVLTDYILKKASITIVTNEKLAEYIEGKSGNPFVLPDPLPEFDNLKKKQLRLKSKNNIFFICTYAKDEPYTEVIEAARSLDNHDITIYISGNTRNVEREILDSIPHNVILTGYISEREYVDMLHSCDVIMDLTTAEDCLVCGAYEAIAAEKPVILSDTRMIRHYFYKGAVYTDNNCQDIADKIEYSIKNKDEISWETKNVKKELLGKWETSREELEKQIRNIKH